MTFSEIAHSPIGTTAIVVEVNEGAQRPELRFQAVHFEKVSRAVRPMVFYGATADEAREKAEKYDAMRKAKYAGWRKK